ncbi:hypothetical protein ABKN59_011916 [Abortiporus biennis]
MKRSKLGTWIVISHRKLTAQKLHISIESIYVSKKHTALCQSRFLAQQAIYRPIDRCILSNHHIYAMSFADHRSNTGLLNTHRQGQRCYANHQYFYGNAHKSSSQKHGQHSIPQYFYNIIILSLLLAPCLDSRAFIPFMLALP